MNRPHRGDILRKLLSLSAREREVLGYICDGRGYKYIAREMVVSVNGVKSHANHIYLKLGLNQFPDTAFRIKLLHEVYCPALHGDLPPAPRGGEVLAIPPEVEKMVDEDEPLEPTNLPPRGKPRTVDGKIIVVGQPGRWRRVGGVAVVTVIVLVVAYGFFNIRNFFSPAATATPQFTATPLNEIDSLATRLSQTMSVPPPTTVVPPTAIPTNTPTITPIPTGTFTPEPTNTPESVLFFDNFDNGMSSQWQVLTGEFLLVNGRFSSLSSTSDRSSVWASIPVTASNYRITLDYFSNSTSSSILSPAFSSPNTYLGFGWNNYQGFIKQTNPNGGSDSFGYVYHQESEKYPVIVEVKNGIMYGTVAGIPIGSVSIGNSSQGTIGLYLQYGNAIDNFKIVALP